MWSQLFTALGYLKIRLKGKVLFDLLVPVLSAIVITLVAFFSGVEFRFFGNGGLLPSASGLFGILIGFFITALAAVATFSNKTVDRKINSHGAFIGRDELTRRQFLCFLFGYLTFLSFCLFFVSMAFSAIHGKNWLIHMGAYAAPIKLGGLFLFSFALTHLFCVCLLGMHYLVYRLHVPSVGVVTVSNGTGSSDDNGSHAEQAGSTSSRA